MSTQSTEQPQDPRVAELLDQYEHLFWEHEGSGIGRNSSDPAEVKTDWAVNEFHAARGYKKGDNPFPPGYVRAEKVALSALDEKKRENALANIESMTGNGMRVGEISDVLRVLERDVVTVRNRLRREAL